MKNLRRMKESGITLIALVVTIIVLLILAGVTINMALSNNGLIQRAKDTSETYARAEQNEQQQLAEFADSIEELTGKTGLTEDKVALVNDNVKNATTLQEVSYEAKKTEGDLYDETKGRGVTVDGANNGGLADQVFYQSEVGAIGTNKLKWYVLSADERGVNLVSEPTKKAVQFKDSSGYDNCLYYLNELSTKLFANEEYGVTESRIHALNLTDIKTAAEQANAGYKVTDNGTERDWSWDLDFVKGAPYDSSGTKVYNDGNVGKKTFTPSYKYYPALYTADSNKEVVANNPLYDETPGNKITTDSGIRRTLADGSNPASKLTVNYTYISYYNARDTMITNLGNFGSSQIAGELFKTNGTNYWLASRRFNYSMFSNFSFYARGVYSGYWFNTSLRYFDSEWIDYSFNCSVRPIITLKSGIQIAGGEGIFRVEELEVFEVRLK